MGCSAVTRPLPAILSFVAFVLGMLALFAGKEPSVLTEYHIITVDTSGLANDFVNNLTGTFVPKRTASLCGGIPGQPCDVTSPVGNIYGGGMAGNVDDITNGVTDHPLDSLDIRDFYSFYALGICEGDITAEGSRKIAKCHPHFSETGTTIPTLLNRTLTLYLSTHLPSPNASHPTLATLGLAPDGALDRALSNINSTLRAAAIILCIGVGCAGLAFLLSVAVDLWLARAARYRDSMEVVHRRVGDVRLFLGGAALFCLVLGAMVATLGAVVAARDVNKSAAADGAGVVAESGMAWVTMAWVAVLCLALVVTWWCFRRWPCRCTRRRWDGPDREMGSVPRPASCQRPSGLPRPGGARGGGSRGLPQHRN
ncbi:hypothetical protein VTK26DRAFT_9020 [Humicola hyalothermophila]